MTETQLKYFWPSLLVIGAVFWLLITKCDNRNEHKDEKKTVDSVITAAKVDSTALRHFRDSMANINKAIEAKRKMLAVQIMDLRQKLAAARQTGAAQIVTAPAECDSLKEVVVQLSDYSSQLESQQDSLIENYEQQGEVRAAIIARQDTTINLLQSGLTTVGNKYNLLYLDYQKGVKSIRWQKAKGKIVAGVALVAIGKIIFDSLKK